jgi:hypothetical protein
MLKLIGIIGGQFAFKLLIVMINAGIYILLSLWFHVLL